MRIVLGVVIAAGIIVTAIAASGSTLRFLLDVTCTGSGCHPVPMAIVGWAVTGVPMLLAWLSRLRFGSSRLATWAIALSLMLAIAGLLTFVAGQDFVGDESLAEDAGLFAPGWLAAWLALVVSAGIERFSRLSDVAYGERPSLAAFRVLAVCEAVALAVAVVVAAVA